MIRLTCTMPASPDDLATFIDAARQLGVEEVRHDDEIMQLVAHVGLRLVPAIEEPPEPKKAPAKKVAAKKKGAASKPAPKATAPQAGTVALAILTAISDADGLFDGSYAALSRTAYPSSPATAATELGKMERAGWVSAERVNGRVQRVGITTKGREVLARLTDGPAPERTPERPAGAEPTPLPAKPLAAVPQVPAAGLKPPSGGWA